MISMTLKEMASMKEGTYFDRKSARKEPKEIAQHLIGFANAGGGILAIGIEDDGELTGFQKNGAKPVEKFNTVVYEFCKNTPVVTINQVSFQHEDGSDDFVLVFTVEPSLNLVIHASNDDVYLRINDTTKKLSHDEVTRLEYEKKQVRFEDTFEPYAKFDDLDQELLDRYRKALGSDSPIQKILEAKGFQKDEHYTKAAVLLFSKDPTKFMPTARMRFLRYDGTVALPGTQMNIVKDITFDQSIPKILEKAKEVIGMQLRDFQFLGPDGRFISLPEYPEFAWMEGMVNALVHRDYSFGGDYVRIKMFDDRLEIFSPSPLPPTITFENMTYTRWSRNERIASVLTLFGWVRELNEGVERMIKDMREMGLPDLEYTQPNPHSVLLTLRNNIDERKSQKTVSYTEHFDEHSFDGCTEEEIKVLKFVAANGRITAREASSVISKAIKSASLLLRRLGSRKLLLWNGKSKHDPSQYYSLPQKHK